MEYEIERSGTAEIGMGMNGVGIERDGYWVAGGNEEEIWATEEEYDQASQDYRQLDGGWNGSMDYRMGGVEGRQSRSGSEPSHKKSKNTHGDYHGNGSRGRGGYQGEFVQGTRSGTPPASNGAGGEGGSSSGGVKGKGTGRMFFKTKLCCKFRAGTCPYSSNCNFAHGMEELRKPPPNWQEIVAAQEEDRSRAERRGENQIPCVSSSGGGSESQRLSKSRNCKKFYTDEGCPYGDRCNFMHDDQSRSRESVAISLGPTTSTGSGNGTGNVKDGNGLQKPLNWKTRICNKWETTGHCPFGEKCHFAHGQAELQKYGGGIPDIDNGDTSGGPCSDSKQMGTLPKSHTDAGSGQVPSIFNTDNYVPGTSNQRTIGNFVGQKQGQKILPKWKGPDKISKIYGDWIEDNEWEYIAPPPLSQIDNMSQVEDEIPNEA